MKTAEEILNGNCLLFSDPSSMGVSRSQVVNAMHEFAAQEVAKEVEAYKERLKAEIGERITNDNHDSCAQAFDHGLNTALTIIDTTK